MLEIFLFLKASQQWQKLQQNLNFMNLPMLHVTEFDIEAQLPNYPNEKSN